MADEPEAQPTDVDGLGPWFDAQLPEPWFVEPVTVAVDRDEILVTGRLAAETASESAAGAVEHREQTIIDQFREATREQRIDVARRAEALFGRKVSWAASCGETCVTFTNLSVPVMTRLRLDERTVLDTLVAAGVARSRSDALGWCVRQVATHQGEWIDRLRDAICEVERVRAEGPPH